MRFLHLPASSSNIGQTLWKRSERSWHEQSVWAETIPLHQVWAPIKCNTLVKLSPKTIPKTPRPVYISTLQTHTEHLSNLSILATLAMELLPHAPFIDPPYRTAIQYYNTILYYNIVDTHSITCQAGT